MGQKVHPYGFRLGFNKPWRSRWFAKQGYAKLLQEDLELKDAPAGAAEVGGRELDRSGPPGQQAAGDHPHVAAGHHHRAQGRGDREAQASLRAPPSLLKANGRTNRYIVSAGVSLRGRVSQRG